jgi:TRAP-type C4-dicarboxylate transport system substrate-binding protein
MKGAHISDRCSLLSSASVVLQHFGATALVLFVVVFLHRNAFAQTKPESVDIPQMNLSMGFFNNLRTETALGEADAYFAKEVARLSGGRITVTLHPSGSLCAETNCIQDVLQGSLDIGVASDSNYGSITTAFYVLGMPYIWKDHKSQDSILNEWLGSQMGDAAANAGLKVLFYIENDGFRNLWHNMDSDIRVPSDVPNIKLRTTNSPVELAIDRAYGFQPVTVGSREMFSALGQKVVRGMLNNNEWMIDGKYYEVVPKVTIIGVQIGYEPVTMQRESFEKLPASVQKILLDAGHNAQLMHQQAMESVVAKGFDLMKQKGVKVYRPTDAELAEWTRIAPQVWAQFSKEAPRDLIDRILREQGCASIGCAPTL